MLLLFFLNRANTVLNHVTAHTENRPHSLIRTSPKVQSSIMIHTGFSVMTPISLTMCGWSNWRIVTAEGTNMHTSTDSACMKWVIFLLMPQVYTHAHTHRKKNREVLHASCKNFSLTLSDVQFLQVLMATWRAGLSCRATAEQLKLADQGKYSAVLAGSVSLKKESLF